MRFVAEHAFYTIVDLESMKFIKHSEIRMGSVVHVDHGDPMSIYMFFREYFGSGNETKYLPMFVHTHPIGASYFSSLDMNTLQSYSGMVSPMKMGMQVVTERSVLTRIGWMESITDFQHRKKQDPASIREFLFKPIESFKILDQNKDLYDEIRKKSYIEEKKSFLGRMLQFGRRITNNESASDVADRMKKRGVLKDDDY